MLATLTFQHSLSNSHFYCMKLMYVSPLCVSSIVVNETAKRIVGYIVAGIVPIVCLVLLFLVLLIHNIVSGLVMKERCGTNPHFSLTGLCWIVTEKGEINHGPKTKI